MLGVLLLTHAACSPQTSSPQLTKAQEFIQQDDYQEAERLAREAIFDTPLNSEPYYTLGVILDEQSRYSEAEKAYRAAIKHSTGQNGHFLNSLGLNLAKQGYFEEALKTLEEALQTFPGNREIIRNTRIVKALDPFHRNNEYVVGQAPPTPKQKPEH